VLAVPGPVHSRASIGTNQLLCDGAAPVTDVADVLVALGLDGRWAGRSRYDSRRPPRSDARVFVDACRQRPHSLEDLAAISPRPLTEVALAVARLEHDGWLRETAGWFEAVDEWADLA